MELIELVGEDYSGSEIILDSFQKANSVINNPENKVIICSVSGGGDSDIVLDICHKVDEQKKIIYVWFDTGLEYQATKDHLIWLEQKYGIEILRYKAKKAIPLCCKEYGQPFLSKFVSEMISRLQLHNFQFQDESYEDLSQKYKNCQTALKWWTNTNSTVGNKFDISRFSYLKEFMISNPPWFNISAKCCDWAKKKVAHDIKKEMHADLSIVGVRKAEGGIRSTRYKNCYTIKDDETSEYRPIFWYTNTDKTEYEKLFDVTHSKCYTEYGLDRTGCAGCPFGKYYENELNVIQQFEPKLYKAVNNIFKDSYEYTRQYRDFQKHMKN